MNRELFEVAESLILKYDIKFFGMEAIPEVGLIKAFYAQPDYRGYDIRTFVELYSVLNVQSGGMPLSEDFKEMLRVALDKSLTFDERRKRLVPLLDRGMSYRYVLEAIYGDSTDISFVSVDADDYLEVSAFEDEVSAMVYAVNRDLATIGVDKGNGAIAQYKPSELRSVAKQGSRDGAVLYCGYREHYLRLLDEYDQRVHAYREDVAARKLGQINEPVLVDFGTYHMDSLTRKLDDGGLTLLLQVESLSPGIWGYASEEDLFTPRLFYQKAREQMADLGVIDLGGEGEFSGCERFLEHVRK